MIDAKTLNNLLRYEPLTGRFFWLPRSKSLFPTHQSWLAWNTKYANKPALNTFDVRGYKVGRIFRQTLKAHRVAWTMMTGHWPIGEIDHENKVRNDNRWINLREVQHIANCRNKVLSKKNSSGQSGVWFNNRDQIWMASIHNGNNRIHLGCFKDKEDAVSARKIAERELGYHPTHGVPALVKTEGSE